MPGEAALIRLGRRTKVFLGAASTGILLFLLVKLLGGVTGDISRLFASAREGFPTLRSAELQSAALLAGLCLGLLGPARRPLSWRLAGLLGVACAGPALLGVWLGELWYSQHFRLGSLGLASGAILYLVGELLHLGREHKEEPVLELGLLSGFILAFGAEMLLSYLH